MIVRQKEVLTRDQVEQFITTADSFDLQLMILMFVQTGMRVSELTNFKINWINAKDLSIRIQTNYVPEKWSPKRDSERALPLNEELLRNLKRHVGKRKKGYVFKSQKKTSTKTKEGKKVTKKTHGRYEYRSIIRKINAISKKVLGRNTGTHIFRATYATHLLNDRVNIEQIRKLLGHSDIRTTFLYIRSLPDYSSWEQVRNINLMHLNVKLKE